MTGTSDPVRLVVLGALEPGLSQAVYHALAERMTSARTDTIILCHPARPYVCLGYHDVLDDVLDADACRSLGLPILRRRVGGGTTYLDANQLFYQLVFYHERVPVVPDALYAYLLGGPLAQLRALGLDATLRATNELEVSGQRIAGVGGGRMGEAAVVVGNYLFDFDFDTLPRIWRAPTRGFAQLARAALRERLTTLRAHHVTATMEHVVAAMVQHFETALHRPVVPGALDADERALACTIAERLASPAFLALHADTARATSRQLKIAAGVFVRFERVPHARGALEASLRLRDDVIDQAHIECPPGTPWPEASQAAIGRTVQAWRADLPT